MGFTKGQWEHVAATEGTRSGEVRVVPVGERPTGTVSSHSQEVVSTSATDVKEVVRIYGLIHHSRAPKKFVKFRGMARIKGVGARKKKKGQMGLPPQIEVTPRLRQTFRFYINASISARPIILRDVFGALGGICSVANTTLKAWATSFRIVSLDMYMPNGGAGEISWIVDNTDQGPDEAYDVTIPANISVTEGIHTSPPSRSVASDWVNIAGDLTDELFRVSSSTSGAVLDMDVEYTLPNEFTAASITIAAGTLGVAYYLALDQSGSKAITAINRPTTA